MAGRHALARAQPRRRGRRLLTAAVVVATVLAGAAVALWPRDTARAPTAGAGPQLTGPAETVAPDRSAARPSRGGGSRAHRPESSPAPAGTPSDGATTPREPARGTGSDAVPDGGEVVATGTCQASFYWEPQPTASGEVFDPEAMTAAHKSWDFDTRVRVTNLAGGQSVVVRINDRGPYIDGRCIDLSRGAFREIAQLDTGVITVTYEVLSD